MNNDHGAGKGDADRTSDSKAFADNFAEINFPNSDEGFEISNNGKRKVKYYGVREPSKMEFVEHVPGVQVDASTPAHP
jgi:hypothetical protein